MRMTPVAKVAVVAAGYVLALLAAGAAVAVNGAYIPEPQASGGMQAFGDLLLFIGVFGVLGLVPTGAALFFLRDSHRFWTLLASAGLALALTGVAAATLYVLGSRPGASPAMVHWAAFSVLRILVSPLLAGALLLAAVLARYPLPRRALAGATLLEAAVSAYAGVSWFLPLVLHAR